MTTKPAQIGFKTDRKGNRLAFLWNASRVVWERISAVEAAELLRNGAVEVAYHHFGPNGGA